MPRHAKAPTKKIVKDEATNTSSVEMTETNEQESTTPKGVKSTTPKEMPLKIGKKRKIVEAEESKLTFSSYMAVKLLYFLGLEAIITSDKDRGVFIDFANKTGDRLMRKTIIQLQGEFEGISNFLFDVSRLNIQIGGELVYLPVVVALQKNTLVMEVFGSYEENGYFLDSKCYLPEIGGINIKQSPHAKELGLYSMDLSNYKNSQYHIRDDTQRRVTKVLEHYGAVQIRCESWHLPTLIFFFNFIPSYLEVFKYDKKEFFMSYLERCCLTDEKTKKLSELSETYNKDKQFYFIMNKKYFNNVKQILGALETCSNTKMFLHTKISEVLFPDLNNDILYHLATMCGKEDIISIRHLPQQLDKNLPKLEPMILKPNGVRLFDKLFETIDKNNLSVNFEINSAYKFAMTDEMINLFYPNSGGRPYGPDWYEYLKSGDCLLIWVRTVHFKILRHFALEFRKISEMEFTRNVNHTAENDKELELFGVFIKRFLNNCQPI
jgi:hypothetical protein